VLCAFEENEQVYLQLVFMIETLPNGCCDVYITRTNSAFVFPGKQAALAVLSAFSTEGLLGEGGIMRKDSLSL
jgi:hypothetical protein